MANGDFIALIVIMAIVVGGTIFIDSQLPPDLQGISKFMSVGLKGIGWVVIIGIVVFIVLGMTNGENRERMKTLFIGGFKKRLNQIRRNKKYLRDTPEGREPSIFVENRIILNAMVNFAVRSEITFRYWAVVQGAESHAGELMGQVGLEFKDPSKLRQDLIAYRSGGKDSKGRPTLGWNRQNLEVVALLNQFFDLSQKVAVSADNKFKDPNEYGPEGSQFNAIQARAKELLNEINDNHDQYQIREKAFAAHHVIKAYREIILTMSNVTGEYYEHPMKFAKPGATFKGGTGYFGPSFTAEADPMGNPKHEVNQYGEYIKDVVALKVNDDGTPNITGDVNAKLYEKRKPRRIENREDIINYLEFPLFLKNISLDWQALAQDIRHGLWHPKSRTKGDYTHALQSNVYPEWADAEIHGHGAPTSDDPALDLKALADPGRNVYWGRKEFSDPVPPKENPWPALTSVGLKEYMEGRVKLDMKNQELGANYLSYYPVDSEAVKKVVEKGKVIVPIGARGGHGKSNQH